jgi:hypothetical protein
MLSASSVVLTLAIVFILWVLYVLFVKKSLTGVWQEVEKGKVNEYMVKHNKFTNNISIHRYNNGVVEAVPVETGKVCDMLVVLGEGVSAKYLMFDDKANALYIVHVDFTAASGVMMHKIPDEALVKPPPTVILQTETKA